MFFSCTIGRLMDGIMEIREFASCIFFLKTVSTVRQRDRVLWTVRNTIGTNIASSQKVEKGELWSWRQVSWGRIRAPRGSQRVTSVYPPMVVNLLQGGSFFRVWLKDFSDQTCCFWKRETFITLLCVHKFDICFMFWFTFAGNWEKLEGNNGTLPDKNDTVNESTSNCVHDHIILVYI